MFDLIITLGFLATMGILARIEMNREEKNPKGAIRRDRRI